MYDKKIILEQKHNSTGTKVFLISMEDRYIKHLIQLARDSDLVDLMRWNPFFELHKTEAFIESISCYALPYS